MKLHNNIYLDENESQLAIEALYSYAKESINKQCEGIGDSCLNLIRRITRIEYYEPKEPLIKDEKIRKAVRAWAECNNIPYNETLDVFEYLDSGSNCIRWHYVANSKPYNRCIQFEYISSDEIYAKQNDREATIEELCGSEE